MTSKMRKPLFVFTLILLLAVALAACGGSKATPEPTVAPPPTWKYCISSYKFMENLH